MYLLDQHGARFDSITPTGEPPFDTLLVPSQTVRTTREFEDEGFKLVVTEPALDYIVSESLRRETGARGLAAILTRYLEDAAFDTFADNPGCEVRLEVEAEQLSVKYG